MSAAPAPAAAAQPNPATLLRIVYLLAALLVLCAATAAWALARNWQAASGAAGAAPAAPTFLALENMVVNLHDADGERFVQIGITLELDNDASADRLRQYLPVLRSSILLLVSQRSAAELLRREGKERLAADIRREAAQALGRDAQHGADAQDTTQDTTQDTWDAQGGDPQQRPRARRNPVQRVLFSSFIIQ